MRPHVLILGCGFGGLFAARALNGAALGDDRIAAKTLVWAAGVKASGLGISLGTPLDAAGRAIVQPDLSLAAHPEVFVIGDLACIPSHEPPVPGVAPAAKQMGRLAAKNILQRSGGKNTLPFRFLSAAVQSKSRRITRSRPAPSRIQMNFSCTRISPSRWNLDSVRLMVSSFRPR